MQLILFSMSIMMVCMATLYSQDAPSVDAGQEDSEVTQEAATPEVQPPVTSQATQSAPIVPSAPVSPVVGGVSQPAASMPQLPVVPVQQVSSVVAPTLPAQVPPVQPSAVQQPVPAKVDVEAQVEATEIDTDQEGAVDLSPQDARGNWFEKRRILKAARKAYETLRQKVEVITQYEKSFADKRIEGENSIVQFFKNLGFERADIVQVLAALIEKLEAERSKAGELSVAERAALDAVQNKKKELEQIKGILDLLPDMLKALNEAYAVLQGQINLAHTYEQKSWENYEKIAQLLNDRIADQLLAEMKTNADNIDTIDTYIKGTLTNYVSTLIGQIHNQTDLIRKYIDDLKAKDVDLMREVEESIKATQGAQDVKVEKAASNASQKLEETFFVKAQKFFTGLVTTVGLWADAVWKKIVGIFA